MTDTPYEQGYSESKYCLLLQKSGEQISLDTPVTYQRGSSFGERAKLN
jgi:hypothetical protein